MVCVDAIRRSRESIRAAEQRQELRLYSQSTKHRHDLGLRHSHCGLQWRCNRRYSQWCPRRQTSGQVDCDDSATVHLKRSTLRSASSFFSSSATFRLRNIAIETTKTNNSREPRARASYKYSATVHLRDIALTPRTAFTVSRYGINTRNRFLNCHAPTQRSQANACKTH